jgi:hypothetical protein
MRILILAAPAALALALSACGPTMGSSTYTAEFDQLAQQCRERGGILAPTGQQSGRPQNDNVCKVTGLPTSRVSGG